MTTAPEPVKPNRTPWIIVGILGCLVVCLFAAFIAVAGYLVFVPQPPVAVNVPAATPTRVSLGLPSPTIGAVVFPTPSPLQPTPTAAEPTKPPVSTAAPTLPPVPPTPTRPPASATTAAPTGKIAFSKCEDTCDLDEQKTVWVMNMDGSGAKKILDKAAEPAFHPDGTKLAYYHFSDGIFVANVDGTNSKKVVGDTFTESVQWSHDGRWLAFGTRPNLQGNISTDVVSPDGTGRRGVAVGRSPSWSHDDTQIVFDTCRGSNCGIYRSSSAGGQDAIPIITDGGGLPSWSPDSKRIVYQAEIEGQKQLFVINPDGSGKRQLTRGSQQHVGAAWSPDGNYIFYRTPEGDSWGIWRINVDGTNPVKLIDNVPPVDWAFERLAVVK